MWHLNAACDQKEKTLDKRSRVSYSTIFLKFSDKLLIKVQISERKKLGIVETFGALYGFRVIVIFFLY